MPGAGESGRGDAVNGLTIMWGVLGLLLSSFVATGPRADESPSREVLVYAAASLTDVLQRVGEPCARASDVTVKYSFAGTPTLAKQIEAGAQPDVFVSADEEWMNYVDERGLVDHASRRNLLTNRLVLIAPAASPVNLKLLRGVRLRDALGRQGRLSLADPASVPAGRYAQAALTSLGGEAPLGIVYRTDALAEPRVRVVDEFPADSHPPIVYPAALVKGHDPRAAAFLACLGGEAASAGFRRAGFTPLGLEHAQ
jgi:molybdate transport system substrate-binding protein